MNKYILVAQSACKPGMEAEYDDWYENVHRPDMLRIPGVKSCRRYDFEMAMFGPEGGPCLAIYEVEAEDIASVVAAMNKAGAEGAMRQTNALDGPASVLWFYRLRS